MKNAPTGPVKDLGILFNPKLQFDCYTNNKVIRYNIISSLTIRNYNGFIDKYTLKFIYCSLMRSTCDYASILWSPFQMSYIFELEKK